MEIKKKIRGIQRSVGQDVCVCVPEGSMKGRRSFSSVGRGAGKRTILDKTET
jgi:hypothetical protein